MHQSECNTRFCPPSEIQAITHIKRISLLKLPSFLHQKYVAENLTINQIAELTLSSRSTVIKYLNEAKIPIREEEHRRGGNAYGVRKRNGRFIINRSELELLNKIKMLKAEGLNFQQIADLLHGLRLPTKKGGKWTRGIVQKIDTVPNVVGLISLYSTEAVFTGLNLSRFHSRIESI